MRDYEKLLLAARCALADLEGIAGDRDIDLACSVYPIALTIGELRAVITDPEPNGKPQYYVSTCPDTGKQFLVEHGKDCDKAIVELTMETAETIRRQFLHKETPTGKFRRQADLMSFLADEFKRYQAKIQPLYPANLPDDIAYREYDEAKNEFLELLWDVISRHFEEA